MGASIKQFFKRCGIRSQCMVRCHISVHSLPSELFSLSLVILSPHTDLTVHYVTLGFKFDIQSCHQWSMVNEKKTPVNWCNYSFHTTGHIREMRLRVENCWLDHLDVIEKNVVVQQHFNVFFFFFAISRLRMGRLKIWIKQKTLRRNSYRFEFPLQA